MAKGHLDASKTDMLGCWRSQWWKASPAIISSLLRVSCILVSCPSSQKRRSESSGHLQHGFSCIQTEQTPDNAHVPTARNSPQQILIAITSDAM